MTVIRPYRAARPFRARNLGLYIFLLILTAAVGFPLLLLVGESFMHSNEIIRWPPIVIPSDPTLENYTKLFSQQDLALPRWLFNSVFVAATYTVAVIIVCSLAAYAFARLNFPGRNILFFLFLATITIPSQVTFIPNYLLMRDLKFLDTYNALIWPGVANVFGVFLLRQFFMQIPKELEEAAILDGATRFGVYWRIIMPLSMNALIALGIFVFLNNYNDLFWPLLVTNRLEMRTLPAGLTVMNGAYGTLDRGLVLSGATFASLPVLAVYIIFQRRILKGITLTGMGGQ
jgi:multiple sugar transport system permease protein